MAAARRVAPPALAVSGRPLAALGHALAARGRSRSASPPLRVTIVSAIMAPLRGTCRFSDLLSMAPYLAAAAAAGASSSIARAPSSPRTGICEQQSAKKKWRRRPAAAAPPRRLEQVALPQSSLESARASRARVTTASMVNADPAECRRRQVPAAIDPVARRRRRAKRQKEKSRRRPRSNTPSARVPSRAPVESVSPSPRDKDRERQPENRERELDIEGNCDAVRSWQYLQDLQTVSRLTIASERICLLDISPYISFSVQSGLDGLARANLRFSEQGGP